MSGGSFDAAVVGGGLAGRIAALAVAQSGLNVLHVAPSGPHDRRTSALMGPSVGHLQRLGIVADPPDFGQPLRQIRIIDATARLLRAPETLFDSAEAGLDAFGWNFANATLAQRCKAVAERLPNLSTRSETVTHVELADEIGRLTLSNGATVDAELIVGADGRGSTVRAAAGIPARERAFAEAALVADIELDRPLQGQSVEFHYPHGPFTLVPAGERRANLVWIDRREVLDAARNDTSDGFAARLNERAQHLFGTVRPTSQPVVFPLSTLTVASAGAGRAVLVGEAAHAFPPIGAQGLNLGLRDVADLTVVLSEADRTQRDWAQTVVRAYAHRRAGDLLRTGTIVDTLFRSLLADLLPAQALRSGGLWALKLAPFLRRRAFALGMGSD